MNRSTTEPWINQIIQTYGDLLYDLCENILWSPSAAPLAFRAVLLDIKKRRHHENFKDYERAWIIRTAYEKLTRLSATQGRRLTPSEQIMLDSTFKVDARLKQFDSYFHRLSTAEQLLLLLRDKYGIPYPEIAAATGLPEDSLKMRRQQALRTLEEWLWPDSVA